MAHEMQAAPVTPTSASPSPPGGSPAAAATAAATTTEPPVADGRTPSMPVEERVRRDLEQRTRGVIDALYQLAARVADGRDDVPQSVADNVQHVVHAIAQIDAMRGHIHTQIPKDVMDLVDAGRNPDSYTRTFINRLASENQYSLGQYQSMRAFRDQLGVALSDAFPSLKPSIEKAQRP
ncbi:transcription coregulator [Malassezia pachydermatis]|uniref:Mediator of RNA polymerase II transcription subunit 10 n=1 Tax=Malassezia pachydermatis TaxID=77020 RepID=A0A0M9VQW2_9BASI|nr:transcription subunit of srb subcomplex of rna polymerase ii [Malassezia pachydermatis]KOS15925.1 transcription subunit of srb subcomplex of rna polymerase ii [Malassezia pachydermatis]